MDDKELYRKKLRAELEEWEAGLDQLRAKAKQRDADARIKLEKQVASLQAKLDEARMKLKELGETTDEAWESVKSGFVGSWAVLRAGFRDAKEKFKD